MAKFIWTSKDFKRCLRSLYEAKSKEKNPELLKVIDNDIFLLKSYIDFDFDEHKPQDDYLKMYRLAKSYLYPLSYLWDDLTDFNDLANGIFVYPNEHLQRINFTKNDLITLTHDFYKSLGGNIYKTFRKNFQNIDNHLSFQKYKEKYDSRAFTIPVSYLDEYFVKIYQSKNITDLASMVHEYGHVVAISTNYKYNIDNYFSEIIPLFMELLVLDYYYNLTKDKTVYLYAIGCFNKKVDQGYSLTDLINIMQNEKEKFKNSYELWNMTQKLDISEDDFNLSMEDINGDAYIYLPAYMITIELYKSYQNDPEKTLDIIDKMLKFNLVNLKEDYQKLLFLGIKPNYNLEEYERVLKQKELALRR